jgi:endonuclease/exonuclease/phosphatase (EEP) superfamily protein YafD
VDNLVVKLRRLGVGLALIYCLGSVALALLWTFVPRGPWWLGLANLFAPHLFLPLLLVLPAALALRSWPLRGAALLSLAAFLALFGGLLLPRSPLASSGTPLRVMTFNHLFSNPEVGGVTAALRGSQADLVALQELSPAVAQSVWDNLLDRYPYQVLLPDRDGGAGGIGLLSRYPLVPRPVQTDFPMQVATLELPGQSVTVINVHPSIPQVHYRRIRRLLDLPVITGYEADRREGQLAAILAQIDRTGGPLIVLGDFNTGDREASYAAFAARLRDAYRATSDGFGFTFPNRHAVERLPVPFPLVRIDYIWTSPSVAPVSTRVDCADTGSDHCSLVAELRVKG